MIRKLALIAALALLSAAVAQRELVIYNAGSSELI